MSFLFWKRKPNNCSSKFNGIMKKFKDRLSKLGFDVVGHPYSPFQSPRKDNKYRVYIYKKMFNTKTKSPK